MRRAAAGLIAMLVLTAPPGTGLAEPMPEGKVRVVDVRTPAFVATGPRVWRSAALQEPHSDYLRLHFTDIVDTSATDYTVVVRDYRNVPVLTFARSDFASRPEFWTHQVFRGVAVVEVRGDVPPTGLSFTIKEYAYQARAPHTLESIIEGDQSRDVYQYASLPTVQQAARPVAKLTFVDAGQSFTCTGFLINDDVLMTNDHCVNSQALCATAIAIFGFQLDAQGVKQQGEEHDCLQVLAADDALDYALLRIAGKPGATFGHLTLAARDVGAQQPLYVVQHPFGAPKKVSIVDCSVGTPVVEGRRRDGTDFSHVCDTAKGSSGSPMLAIDDVVVGLHHLGTTPGKFASVNRAVSMKEILPMIRPIVSLPE
jgi:V8-like Glu-specific endopeptidase